MGQTPKEYAISLGLAKPGRGRLSLAAHTAIDKAISEGVVFDSPIQVLSKPKADKPNLHLQAGLNRAPATPKAPVEDDDGFNLQERAHPEGTMWKSVETGQLVNETQVCCNSGYSLGWCTCDEPSAIVSPGVMEKLTLV